MPTFFSRSLYFSLLILLGLSRSFSVSAQTRLSREAPPIPKTLYRWVAAENLSASSWLTREYSEKGLFPLTSLNHSYGRGGYSSAKYFPQLKRFRGTFLWSNPVTGMMSNFGEVYGNRLIALRLKDAKPRVLSMISDSGRIRVSSGHYVDDVYTEAIDLSGVDLVFHQHINSAKVVFQEWILLNNFLVESVSANPELLREEIEPFLHRLQRGETFSDEELHYFDGETPVEGERFWPRIPIFNDAKMRPKLVDRLLDYIKSPTSEIAEAWRSNDCSDLFTRLEPVAGD